MENNKLISMTEFVNRIDELIPREIDQYFEMWKQNQLGTIKRYSAFLSQPLTLSMFVPCDDEGNVLQDPGLMPSQQLNDYREAKSKVLFEGFKLSGDMIIMPDFDCEHLEIFIASIVEDMTAENLIGMKLTLTPAALKQIYG